MSWGQVFAGQGVALGAAEPARPQTCGLRGSLGRRTCIGGAANASDLPPASTDGPLLLSTSASAATAAAIAAVGALVVLITNRRRRQQMRRRHFGLAFRGSDDLRGRVARCCFNDGLDVEHTPAVVDNDAEASVSSLSRPQLGDGFRDLKVLSPSDLSVFMESPFVAWMNRLERECPDDPRCLEVGEDPVGWVFALRGEGVEERLLAWFYREHPDWTIVSLDVELTKLRNKARQLRDAQGGGSSSSSSGRKKINPKSGRDLVDNSWRMEAMELTLDAIERANVVFQAPVYDPSLGLFGICDFIVRRPGKDGRDEVIVWDTKLALNPKVTHICQLTAYAEALNRRFQARAEGRAKLAVTTLGLVLGEQAAERGYAVEFRPQEARSSFLALWARLRAFHSAWDPAGEPPDPAQFPKAAHAQWISYAMKIMEDADDLRSVAGMRKTCRDRMVAQGVHTMSEFVGLPKSKLAALAEEINSKEEVLEKLHFQAGLQAKTKATGKICTRVVPGARWAMRALPKDNPGDVFFDLEGMPLPPPRFGQEYLLGAMTRDKVYKDWWSFSLEQERDAFCSFTEWLAERRKQYPGMHVYHYAPYERSAIFRETLKYPDEAWAQQLERFVEEGVLVDLFKILKNSLGVGLSGYGLKKMELLFRGARDTAVSGAQDSLRVYQAWLDDPKGFDCQSDERLESIRIYNEDDCLSTMLLLKWMRKRLKGATPSKEQSEREELLTQLAQAEYLEHERKDKKKLTPEEKMVKALKKLQNMVAKL